MSEIKKFATSMKIVTAIRFRDNAETIMAIDKMLNGVTISYMNKSDPVVVLGMYFAHEGDWVVKTYDGMVFPVCSWAFENMFKGIV